MFFLSRTDRISRFSILLAAALAVSAVEAAPRSRVTRAVDVTRVKQLAGGPPRQAQAQYDVGSVEPGMAMNYMLAMFKPSTEQQADLNQLLVDQQNPSSPNYHKWLTPEEYGNRFGLSSSDYSRVTAWLVSQGFKIDQNARGAGWVAFSGTAAQVSTSLRTSLHYFQVDGKKHFANMAAPSVPEALSDVIGGFRGLHDFRLQPHSIKTSPDYNSKTGTHALAPEDWETIYNVTPLATAGMDGTGQSIAIVGASAYSLADVQTFRLTFGLPTNNPHVLFYGGTNPGVIPDILFETDLDLEWAGAIAPKAAIYYVYGQDAFTAALVAIDANVAPILSISYGGCETDFSDPFIRAFFQQGNAQGITIVSSSGDSGAAGCDFNGNLATHGLGVSIPNVFPEVTSIGGTLFSETPGATYWGASNDKLGGTAQSYIPEVGWNETNPVNGLAATGGGISQFYSRPAWQQAPGLSNNLNSRYVPDISFAAAFLHDPYLVVYQGGLTGVGGTSAPTPSFAGVLALLNQYQISKKIQSSPGLGNINPQLYHLAQSAPSIFHDITGGDNMVPCLQATSGCVAGSFGFSSTAGYDSVTGLGSADINALVTQWNTAANGVNVKLSLSSTKVSVNGTVTATATVTASGTGTPTGSVDFAMEGLPLGNVPLTLNGATATAAITFPVYNFGATGDAIVSATYSGDSAFSGGGATADLTIITPAGSAGIVVLSDTAVNPSPENPQGLSWQTTFFLTDVAGVASNVTGFSIDGVAQPLAKYFPAPTIPANGTLSATAVFYNLPAPVAKKFSVTGIDAAGNTFTREFSIQFLPLGTFGDYLMSAATLTPVQDVSADPSCQWPVQVTLTDIGGAPSSVTTLQVGGVDMSPQIPAIFGTTRLNSYSSLTGTVCFGGLTAPASVPIFTQLNGGASFNEITVSFLPAPATPVKLTPTPATLSLAAADTSKPVSATLNVDVSDKTQAWTVSIGPNNRTTSWLSVSPQSGTGPAKITVTANPATLGPGAFGATLLIQSPNAPQPLTVPVMFVLGGGPTITGVANPGSHKATAAPGQLLEVYGSGLANSTGSQPLTGNALPSKADGVTATVNGNPANLVFISPGQVNIQIPYEAGAGPAVVGINNNGKVAGFETQIVPASPGIFTDLQSNILPTATVAQGGISTLYFTGAGDITPELLSGYAPSSTTTVANLPVPRLPVSITVGGMQAFTQFLGIPQGLVGVVQLNFIVPSTVPVGTQPVVVTVNGVASPAANIQVTAKVSGS